jgi:outer membrane receptor protein involved in Fe transport
MLRHRSLWMLALVLLALTPTLNAQTTTGTVRGVVKDQNGAPVADAEVSARNVTSGAVRTTPTRADGSYVMPGMVPAAYEFTVRKIGFTPLRRSVTVQIGATMEADFTVQAGAVQLEAVTVESEPAIEMRTSEVATNVTARQIEQLPTVNRNFLDLASLAPGVSVSEDRINSTGFRTFSAGGASPNQSNVFVDGASLKNDLTGGGVAGQDASRGNPFPRSAIQEYRVITQNFKAEYQKASSAIITATTRSGSNTWTGNALFGYQNKNLVTLDTFQLNQKARNPGFAEPDFTRYVTSLSLGGPLVRNRLFFFGSYEGNYQDRSNLVDIRPATGFVGIDSADLTQYNDNFTSPFRETLLFGKLTYALDAKSSAELSFNNRHETDIRDFGGGNAGRAYPAAVNFRQNVTSGLLRYNRFWGAWLNETKLEYSSFRRNPSPNAEGAYARQFRYLMPGTSTDQTAWIGSDVSEQDFIQDRVGLRNDITYSGAQQHVIKAGLSADFLTYDIKKLNNVVPRFDITRSVNPANYEFTTDSSAASLQFNFRNPYRMIYATGAGIVNRKNTQLGVYIQDDWTPTPRLTVNLGLRWDLESGMINTDYVTPQNVVDTLTRYNDSLPTPLDLNRYISTGNSRKPFYGAFQPRLGFSYGLDDDNRTTIFGGVGIYYDRSLFDFSIDEIQKIERPTFTVRFAHPDSTTLPPGTVAWQDSYLTADTSVLSSLARSTGQPEAFLIDNKLRPPKSTQWSLGVRRRIGSMVAALTYQGQRGTDLFVYGPANAGLDTTGLCCRFFNLSAHGFSNFIYSTNDGKTWYDALSLQLDRPFRQSVGGIGWGGGIVYTYAVRYIAGLDNWGDLAGSFPFGFPSPSSIPKRTDCCGSDERHRVVANWITDFPQLAGIQFSGLITLGSGARQDVGTHPRFGGVEDSTYFPSAFQPPMSNFLIFGGWTYRRVDFKLRKDFPAMGGTRLGATVDIFNVFNYMNFTNYPFTTNASQRTWSVGQPQQVLSDPRRIQLGVEYTF